jgi:acyl-CoA dehydrogenase
MDFALSTVATDLVARLEAFMDECVYPAEAVYEAQMDDLGDPHAHPQIVEDLKSEARERGLWNLFLPHKTKWTDGLSTSTTPRSPRSPADRSTLPPRR